MIFTKFLIKRKLSTETVLRYFKTTALESDELSLNMDKITTIALFEIFGLS